MPHWSGLLRYAQFGCYEVPTNYRNTPHFVILPILQFLFLSFIFSTCTWVLIYFLRVFFPESPKQNSHLWTLEGKRFLTHWQSFLHYSFNIIPNLILSSTVVTKRATLPFSHRVYGCLCFSWSWQHSPLFSQCSGNCNFINIYPYFGTNKYGER